MKHKNYKGISGIAKKLLLLCPLEVNYNSFFLSQVGVSAVVSETKGVSVQENVRLFLQQSSTFCHALARNV